MNEIISGWCIAGCTPKKQFEILERSPRFLDGQILDSFVPIYQDAWAKLQWVIPDFLVIRVENARLFQWEEYEPYIKQFYRKLNSEEIYILTKEELKDFKDGVNQHIRNCELGVDFAIGKRARIMKGPFRGKLGLIINTDGNIITLGLDGDSFWANLEIDRSWLELL